MEQKTVTSELKIKDRPEIDWRVPAKKRRGEELMKNLGVASALVLCAVTLKSGALPAMSDATDAVLTAVTGDTLLDDQLGKLTFVSSLFPEATLVFGESKAGSLAVPVNGGVVVHAWSEQEPYMAWRASGNRVFSSDEGVVMGIYHGENEEQLVQVMNDSGIACVYGNLHTTAVQTGDRVAAGELLGVLLPGEDCVFEVRVDGVSVDPAVYLSNVS
mgnify:CR=1 FL=1